MNNIAKEAITLGLLMLDPENQPPQLGNKEAFGKFMELRGRAEGGAGTSSLSESEEGSMDEKPKEEDLEETVLEEEETETIPGPILEAEKVQTALGKTNLPDASKARLSEADYQSEDELSNAIMAEVAYVKELTGSGKPFAQGNTGPREKTRTEVLKEQDEGFNEIAKKYGLEVK